MQQSKSENLRDLLAHVHERLSHAKAVDAEARELLVALTHDIERALKLGSGAAALAPHPPRLEALAVQFEADHPSLAQVLRQLSDALGKVGI